MPRLTMLIKGFPQDVKKKAAIFDETELKKFMLEKMPSAYWVVRQAIVIVAFFGGLRHTECCKLALEKIKDGPEGITVTHMRVKQRRSDGLFTKFLIPEEGGFAAKLCNYLNIINNSLNVYTGRVWYTGTKYTTIRKQLMGKNMIAKSPNKLAARFNLPDPDAYTIYSFRRTSATSAADGGSTLEQMQEFFG